MGLLYDREFTELEKNQMISTGQMIDTLKYGEIAECMNGFYEGCKVKRTDYDEIVFTDGAGFLAMTTFAHSSKWIIRSKRRRNKP